MTTATQTKVAASLSDRALLVDLSIRRWQARKKDRLLTQELADTKGSDVAWSTVTKSLVAKDAIAELVRIEGAARAEHRNRTLPWSERKDERIILHTGYFEYTAIMRSFEDAWAPAVATFNQNYVQYREEARRHSPNFRDEDYPDPGTMLGRFSFETTMRTLPPPEQFRDFRLALGDAEVARLERIARDDVQAVIDLATQDIVERVNRVVGHMAERLRLYRRDADGKVENAFFDSVTENVWELVQILQTLNITGGTAIPGLAGDMAADLLLYTPNELRADDFARGEVAAAAEQILERMKEFAA